jgi:hypothetical protein
MNATATDDGCETEIYTARRVEEFVVHLASEIVSVHRMDWEKACVEEWTTRVLFLPALFLTLVPIPLSLLAQGSCARAARSPL